MNELLGDEKVKLGMVGIGCITLIIAIGLFTGHNSVITASGMALIGAIMGVVFGFTYGMVKAA